ncbi:MAG: hypothetical protein M1816_006887 [Peltula sp. TS41687]|nr:MAG: hypothetical protein M1816_006887 [Peltula sp. TS41687]
MSFKCHIPSTTDDCMFFPIAIRIPISLSAHPHPLFFYGFSLVTPTDESNCFPNIIDGVHHQQNGYPERLLIYYGGTAKSVFIGCLKVTSIYMFALTVFYILPGHLVAPEKDWAMITTSYITRPYVLYMYMYIPHYARRSQEQLTRFIRTLPPETELDITTMHFSGRPRFTRLKVAELIEAKGRIGVANLARLPARRGGLPEVVEPHRSRWWKWIAFKRPVKEFYVAETSRRNKGTASQLAHGVWEMVLACVRRGWGTGRRSPSSSSAS